MTLQLCNPDATLLSPPIWMSLQQYDFDGRFRLDSWYTIQLLEQYGIVLTDGMKLVVYDEDSIGDLIDDAITVVTVEYDDQEIRWVANVPTEYTHFSELDEKCQDLYLRFRPTQGSLTERAAET